MQKARLRHLLWRTIIIAITLGILIPVLRWHGTAATYAQAIPGMVIGAGAADPSAVLTINFTDRGVLFPRLDTAQRDGITNPANGLLIYNNETHELQVYDGTAWQVPATPTPAP